jgi:L-alanine-DL-glutamate epimerase-like enolase superfamily enzyme
MPAYKVSAPLSRVRAQAYTIPTDKPEADGTIAWNSTTLVVVEIDAGGKTGLGYTYADASVAPLIDHMLVQAIEQRDAFDVPGAWLAMQRSVRNLGRGGLAATAISAVDCALWDLKAKLLCSESRATWAAGATGRKTSSPGRRFRRRRALRQSRWRVSRRLA